MLHALTYSIIEHLRTWVPELAEVIWMHDNVVLTGRAKPFATVEQLREFNDLLAAGRTDFEEVYNFQIGVHARSVGERSKLSDNVKVALRQPDVPFTDTSGPTPQSAGFFVCDVTAVTPMPIRDVEDATNEHKVYIDVQVMVYRRNDGGNNFTQ